MRRKPILRLSDMYITYNQRIHKLIDKIFERHIYGGRVERKEKGGSNVIVSKIASNANELEEILKMHENNEDDFNFDNAKKRFDEEELEQYIIDRGHSKENYFLYYKAEKTQENNY